jgi:hypothetical protein
MSTFLAVPPINDRLAFGKGFGSKSGSCPEVAEESSISVWGSAELEGSSEDGRGTAAPGEGAGAVELDPWAALEVWAVFEV